MRAILLSCALLVLLAPPLPARAAGAAGKSVAARSQPAGQASSSGLGGGSRLRREELAEPDGPPLPPPPLVDAQGTARYVDRDTRSFEVGAPGRRIPVRWTRETTFRGADPASLEGAAVRVEGHMAQGVLYATVVETR